MRVVLNRFVAALAGITLLVVAGQAAACNTCSPPAPPTVPTNPSPPCNTCGGGSSGGGKTRVDVNVNVNVKSSASSSSSSTVGGASSAFANSSAGGASYGGYSNWSQTPGYPQGVGALNVETGEMSRLETYAEERTRTERTLIQASCIDDTGVPHPASQLNGDRDIDGAYVGEVYRCIAGTHMQWTYSDYDGSHIGFDGGKTQSCQKNEALWFEGGRLTCKTQIQQRQCNERSLLRRFGTGIKVLTLTRIETVTKQRQMATQQSRSALTVMSFDGGVGGFVQ